MSLQIFETHAHYDDAKFDQDRDQLLSTLPQEDIEYVVNVASSIESCKTTLQLSEKYDYIYAAMGVHPSDIDGLNETTFQWLESMTSHKKVVAIGEIGLDYYWEKDQSIRLKQQEWFARQIDLAKKADLPIIVHSRDAAEDTLKVMKENHAEQLDGIIHCYSYSKELSQVFLDMGYYLGIGGVITFKNAKKLVETVEHTPIERLVLETDCPYLSPEPNRGKRNSSLNLIYVAEKIAQIKGLKVEEVIEITRENAKQLYKI